MTDRFGNYEILRKIAAGGMAEVFLAKQTSLGGFERLVCIKRILPHLTEEGDFIDMFQDEANIAANLTHPNVAQIYDIGKADGSYYIAMEYVRGEDLRRVYNAEVARGRAMPLEPAAQIAMYAAAGLDYAHRQTTIDGRPLGIVHRDISPQNILVTYDGHVKIVDFGVAKAANKVTETRSGVLKGKYSYMSPEQASGDPIDARTDIFALAICLYEVTTGTRLFKRENELETLHAVIECGVTAPSAVIPDYDSELEAIILKALSADPDDRHASAGDFERDLERLLINRSHPTSASSLGEYMQDLFAEKLADELLFGGAPWDESNTPSGAPRATRKVASNSRPRPRSGEPRGAEPGPGLSDDATEVTSEPGSDWGARTGTAQAGESWEGSWKDRPDTQEVDDQWGQTEAGQRWDTGSASVSMTATQGHETGRIALPAPSGDVSAAERPPVESKREPRRIPRPTWMTSLALAVLLMGVGAGLTLILTSERGGSRGAMSGPLTLDSEPRGARVEVVGDGADAINEQIGGFRTPFKISEGLPVDGQLRARFMKDGYQVAEVELPTLEVGVVPQPVFAELSPGSDGALLGTLMLLSTPDGAEVWIDGHQQKGTTPLTDVPVPGGEVHRVEFRKEGYRPRWESRFVEPKSRIFIEVNLPVDSAPDSGEAPPGELRHETLVGNEPTGEPTGEQIANGNLEPSGEPDAAEDGDEDTDPEKGTSKGGRKPKRTKERAYLTVTAPMKMKITVGSKLVGETPVTKLSLDPGLHTIKAESPTDGFTLTRKVRLSPGRSETVDLQPRKGKLSLNATPWAWVRIGKDKPAETPVRLDVYEGEYAVLFECPDGKQRKRSAKVSPGQTATLTVNCKE